jgi:hypothetical protein
VYKRVYRLNETACIVIAVHVHGHASFDTHLRPDQLLHCFRLCAAIYGRRKNIYVELTNKHYFSLREDGSRNRCFSVKFKVLEEKLGTAIKLHWHMNLQVFFFLMTFNLPN